MTHRAQTLLWICCGSACFLAEGEPRIAAIGPYTLGMPTFFSKLDGWAAGPNGSLFRTADGGATWDKIAVSYNSTECQRRIFPVCQRCMGSG